MNVVERFKACLGECPLVAIIRGVTPAEVEAIGDAIWAAGIRIIEVPLNSPDPLASIARLAVRFGERGVIGAGTVLDPADVAKVAQAGGQLVVSPNTHTPVIEAAVTAGMISAPGYFTPSEAFDALRAGAHALKFFPAESASPAVLKAQRAVLPKNVPVLVVGGVRPDNMQAWFEAGADGVGLGTGVYRAGQQPGEVEKQARAFVAALKNRT
jgi:2-dehydro-3-deoxyphosphogalactonate aldolase